VLVDDPDWEATEKPLVDLGVRDRGAEPLRRRGELGVRVRFARRARETRAAKVIGHRSGAVVRAERPETRLLRLVLVEPETAWTMGPWHRVRPSGP